MEPLLLSEGSRHRPALMDLSIELAAKASGFRRSLPAGVLAALAHLVRAMNCYYSNLIEGHETHPIDIERALRGDYSKDERRRNLQFEAKAHIAVQQWIDEGGVKGREFTQVAACEIHRRFCERLPDELLWVEDNETRKKIRLVPGGLRDRDVQVGGHVPVSPGAVPRFMRRYEEVFERIGKAEAILATASMHHRLLWIHPFLDGNGRVARLMSHAQLLSLLDTGGVWSVARGLARSVTKYKELLANCDLRRRNDLDGRGNLSEEALADYTRYFLEICMDQVSFMEDLMQPDSLRARLLVWAEEQARLGKLPPRAGRLLEAMLYRGELPRGEVTTLLGIPERSARRITSELLQQGVFVSDSTRAPLRLAFPAALASRWMPGLFPEKRA
ncbi:MAG: Fic family protein [Betaproteobacteria bacterium]